MPLLKCVGPQEASYMMDELHNGVCGFHTGRRTLKALPWKKTPEYSCRNAKLAKRILMSYTPPKQIIHSGLPVALRQLGNGYSRTIPGRQTEEKVYPGGDRLFHEMGGGRGSCHNHCPTITKFFSGRSCAGSVFCGWWLQITVDSLYIRS